MRSCNGRFVVSAALAGVLACLLALLPGPELGELGTSVGWISHPMAQAQGGMDVDIVSPAFADLPLSVGPGEQLVVDMTTAPGARCSGHVAFRDQPPIDLGELPATGGTCSWPVEVPPTARPGTATITIDITRNGQGWTLYGVVYVRAVGESR
jgi:hypothetical protein